MKELKHALLYLWQLPQHLLGLALIRFTGAELMRATEAIPVDIWKYDPLFRPKNRFVRYISGVSLGIFIILPLRAVNYTTALHEHGHSIQSRAWGPLYLPVVGVYSAVFCNLWDRLFHKSWNAYDRHYWYYKTRWAEREADKAGGVDRDAVLRRIPRPDGSRYPAAPKAS